MKVFHTSPIKFTEFDFQNNQIHVGDFLAVCWVVVHNRKNTHEHQSSLVVSFGTGHVMRCIETQLGRL